MVLSAENYYSQEADKEYMSVSQFKDFAGTYGKLSCEFTAIEKLERRWEERCCGRRVRSRRRRSAGQGSF